VEKVVMVVYRSKPNRAKHVGTGGSGPPIQGHNIGRSIDVDIRRGWTITGGVVVVHIVIKISIGISRRRVNIPIQKLRFLNNKTMDNILR
jgi:hypothetical protein